MSKKQKYFVRGLYGFIILLCVVEVIWGIWEITNYYKAKEEKELLIARLNPYFTEQHLTEQEMFILWRYFQMDTFPNYRIEKEKKEGPDFSYIEIEPTKGTEETVALLNHYLFDEFYYTNLVSKEYAEEYGISYGNRMTVDWVMDHLRETAKIFENFPYLERILDKSEHFRYYDLIVSDATYTQYQLSYKEVTSVLSWFGIETAPELGESKLKFREEGQTDFTDMTLEASEYTHQVAAVMNEILFEEAYWRDIKAIMTAKECGLSKENPLTAEWILTHPREAMEIKNGMENYGEIIYDQEKILEKYEEIQSSGKGV